MAAFLFAPTDALGGVYDPPLLMRLFPRSHYGQFCANNAIWRSVGGVVGPFTAGAFLDFMTTFVGREQAYFYIPLWLTIFAIPGFYFLLRLYRSWKKLRGGDAYIPPLITNPVNLAASPT
jgi:MFS family permease